MTRREKIIANYQLICNSIVDEFSQKHDLEFDGWVGDEVGGVASFISQYFFKLSDMVLDLKTNQEKWFIMQWQDDTIAWRNDIFANGDYINYNSYIMGLRYKDL